MNYKSEIGKHGEDLACDYLTSKAYKIIERNYWKPWGELDIIAKDPANTLVFCEVKTMRQSNPAIAGLTPEDNLTAAKLRKLKKTASMYAGFNENLVDENRGWRIDLLAICLPANKITHYENI